VLIEIGRQGRKGQEKQGRNKKIKKTKEEQIYIELDDWGSRVRFQAGAEDFSLHHRVQNGSEAHPASYPMGTREPFPGGKAARA
jgi:hypothetical protein